MSEFSHLTTSTGQSKLSNAKTQTLWVPANVEMIIEGEIPLDDFEEEGPFGEMYCLLYTSPSPRDATLSRMPSSA